MTAATKAAVLQAPAPRRAPPASFRVEVVGRPAFNDAAGDAIAAQLPLIGIQGQAGVRVGMLYELLGRLTASQVAHAAAALLADPITQQYAILTGERPFLDGYGPHWRIEVWLRKTVTDPIEDSVRKAMLDLGLPAPDSVRSGTVYRVLGRLGRAQAERIAVKLLANPLIHRHTVAPGDAGRPLPAAAAAY